MMSTLIINATLKRNTHVKMSTIPSFFNLTVTLQAPTYKLNLETLISYKNNQSQNRFNKKKKVGKILTGGLSSRYNSWG